jgi:oxaloacetate decarboxylase alpha subunit/pyruvate carboxylase subunit B
MASKPVAGSGTPVKAPMPGMIIKYEKNVGDAVNEGETVVVIEAMKMENALPAPASGVIVAINYNSGDSVAKGNVLAVIE